MIITLREDWAIHGADGVNWQLRRAGGRESGEPHWSLLDAMKEARDCGLMTLEYQAHPSTRSPNAIVEQAMPESLFKLLKPDAAIGIGLDYLLTFHPSRPGRFAARRHVPDEQAAPRLLHVGDRLSAALVCFWDHFALVRMTVQLVALPEIMDRVCTKFFGTVRIGRAIIGPSGHVWAVFGKGAA